MSNRERHTQAVCPVCLDIAPALLTEDGGNVVLRGDCPAHGLWTTAVWSGLPSVDSWCGEDYLAPPVARGKSPAQSRPDLTRCPGSCGLCARHEQHTCTAIVEVTGRCNLACPVCFAGSSPSAGRPDPPVAELVDMFAGLFADQGQVNLQLSGGEPTLRDDLPEIVAAAREVGFEFVQLNTNGLRLASDRGYVRDLQEAGLVSVFLQFDGLTDYTNRVLRGRALLTQKLQALENCARAGLAVVLVPTLVPGLNEHEIGPIVRLATRWPTVVRGVHLQPISYFGRYPAGERRRFTLPQVLRLLEDATGGQVQACDFAPSCCEHVRCSFRARYWIRDDGSLEPVRANGACRASAPVDAARRAIAATSRQWSPPAARSDRGQAPADDLDRFLEETRSLLCISGMLFQDVWNLDLERVRRCCVHVMAPGRGLIPFCLWNLTAETGERLYPR